MKNMIKSVIYGPNGASIINILTKGCFNYKTPDPFYMDCIPNNPYLIIKTLEILEKNNVDFTSPDMDFTSLLPESLISFNINDIQHEWKNGSISYEIDDIARHQSKKLIELYREKKKILVIHMLYVSYKFDYKNTEIQHHISF